MNKKIDALLEIISEIVEDTSMASYKEKAELIRKVAAENDTLEGHLEEFLAWFDED
jgi:hypothetical protein